MDYERYQEMSGSGTRLAEEARSETIREEARAMFEQFFECSPDAVLVVNSEGLITRVNKLAEQMFGYTRAELTGQRIELLVPDRFRKEHEKERANYQSQPHMRPMGAGLELFAKRKIGRASCRERV